MSKALRITAFSLAGLLVLGAVGVGVWIATFDPNDYKPWLVRKVQETKQRTLTIPGKITMTFYPKIGLDLGEVHLSERQGAQEFAAVKSAKVSLALMPLLSKQFVVDRIMIDGLRAHLVRHADGSTNFDDLLNEEQSDEQLSFDIAGLSLTDAAVRYDDQAQQRTLEFSDLDLETGRLAHQAASQMTLSARVQGKQPDMQLRLALDSALEYDLDHQHYIFKQAEGSVNGELGPLKELALVFSGSLDLKPDNQRFVLTQLSLDVSAMQEQRKFGVKLQTPGLVITDAIVSGSELEATLKLQEAARTLSAELSLPKFEGTPDAFEVAGMSLVARLKQEGLDAKAQLSGPLAGNLEAQTLSSSGLQAVLSGRQGDKSIAGTLITPLEANLKTQQIELNRLVADLSLPNPGGGLLHFKGVGRASVDLVHESASALLQGKLDESQVDARIGMQQFASPAYNFDIAIDRLDLDRYRSQPEPGKPTKDGKPPSAPADIDLSPLRHLQAVGGLRVGQLKSGKLQADDVALTVRAAQGKLELSDLSAKLYGGSIRGSLSAAVGNPQRFTLKQRASNIHVGPLLRDTLGKDTLEGRGNVDLDVRTSGANLDQWLRALDGSAALQLRDGAVRGINLAQTVRSAKARINALQGKPVQADAGVASKTEQTDFTELSASFRINQGIARSSDLQAKSPLLRLGGVGSIDLPQERLDYRLDATVASTLKGQGGPELEALKGLTIPVQLSGLWSAIQWKVDVAGMAEEAVRHKLDEKKDELRDKARDKLRNELKGLFGH